MFEALLESLPESALACRALYDVASGGYHLPLREHNRRLTRAEVPQYRALYPQVHYDCIEVPVADLLYSLVVNTRSARILETGTSRGFSTCHLAAGARFVDERAAQVISIDPAPAANLFFEGSTLAESIVPVRADSLRFDLTQALGTGQCDFMFFDSLHTYAHLSAELAHYLPRLKLGGLFALHDTFVFDDLGLVVLAMLGTGRAEMLSLPTHRRHAEPARCPGMSIFRKIAPIQAGDLVFPDLQGITAGEQHCVPDPAAIVQRTGGLFVGDARYAAHGMHRGGPRGPQSPALLEPAQAASAAAGQPAVGTPGTRP